MMPGMKEHIGKMMENLPKDPPTVKVYFSAPLFSAAEQEFNARLARWIERLGSFEVFLPQRDVPQHDFGDEEGGPDKRAVRIFMSDFRGIERCNLFFILLDGVAVDSGSACELGVAWGMGKPCIALRTDGRLSEGTSENLFVLGCLAGPNHIAHNFDELKKILLPYVESED